MSQYPVYVCPNIQSTYVQYPVYLCPNIQSAYVPISSLCMSQYPVYICPNIQSVPISSICPNIQFIYVPISSLYLSHNVYMSSVVLVFSRKHRTAKNLENNETTVVVIYINTMKTTLDFYCKTTNESDKHGNIE